MKKKLLSIVLVLSMVISMMPSALATAESSVVNGLDRDENGAINYVALGDSMTNG